jgi:hypothetical protein
MKNSIPINAALAKLMYGEWTILDVAPKAITEAGNITNKVEKD